MTRLLEFFKKKRNVILRCIAFFLAFVVLFSLFTLYDNFRIDVDKYTIASPKIGKSFDGYKIAHLSDYHNRHSDVVDNKIIKRLKKENPDIIVFTGDLIDCRSPDDKKALSFVEELAKIADVYFVTGNHESNLQFYDEQLFSDFMLELDESPITVLSNETKVIYGEGGSAIFLHGIDEPYFMSDQYGIAEATRKNCSTLEFSEVGFNILLAHHPEQLDIYAEYNFDLVYSGHAHGGQITFFGLGLFAPDQGKFPKYTSGLYEYGNTKMLLNRGIGYSLASIRLFCSPHIIITQLKSETF